MIRLGVWCVALVFASAAWAAPWNFEPPIAVSPEAKAGVFVQLESAGRKNVAVSAGWVGVAWDDNRDGVSRAMLALKAPDSTTFSPPIQVSGAQEAAEPAIAALDAGRFALSWEESGRVWVRVVSADAAGKPLALGAKGSTQSSLAYIDGALFAVWAEPGARWMQIRLARLDALADGSLRAGRATIVDPRAQGDQSYPSVAAVSARALVMAWEDRRGGHTVLLQTASRDGGKHFAPTRQLNEAVWNGRNLGYGHGTGVMRVALAASGESVAAVWADKRNFVTGYDVYGGVARGAALTFGPNEKVQDSFGDTVAQWHPAIAANGKGRMAVAWDDDRDGTPDVWLSWRNADGWSDNLAVPGASGAGVQADPSLTMDEAGNLYLVWVEKATLNSPSQIRFVFGRAQ